MRAQMSISLLLSTTILAGLPAITTAQTVPEADSELIVTAQKRSENLQNVPMSLQVLSTKKLDQLNVTDFNDIVALLPSVSIQATSPGSNNVYFRGVASGGDGNHSGPLPSVGTYLDEQPITTIGGALDINIYDIARIEALAGPQGSLYGASSQAGTIRIITNKPDHSGLYGRYTAEVNAVEEGSTGAKIEGVVNVPITDKIAARFVGYGRRDAGYIDNVAGSRSFLGGISVDNKRFIEDDYNSVDVVGGRAALKIDLDDNWTATASLVGQDQRSRGRFAYDPSVGDLKVQGFFPESRRDKFAQAALTLQGKIANLDVTYAGAYLDRKTESQSDYTDYAEAYDNLYASVGGVAGYFYFTDASGQTLDSRQKIIGKNRFLKTSHELRIASPSSDRLRFIAGAFYQRQMHKISEDYQVPGLAAAVSVNNRPGTLWLTRQNRDDRDTALFGELSFDITPKLTTTLGGRLYDYDNSLIGYFGFGRNLTGTPFNAAGSSRTGVAGCFTTTGQTLRDNPNGKLLPASVNDTFCTNLADVVGGKLVPKRTKDKGSTYKFNLTYRPYDGLLVYGTVSNGFRPGGINRRATVKPYEADILTNYELGYKTTLLDGLLRINGAFYHQQWDNFQYAYLGENSFTVINNGPDAEINGLEVEANYNPIPALSLSASAAYNEAKTKTNLCAKEDPSFTCTNSGNSVLSPKGIRLPITPKYKLAANGRYSLGGEGSPYIQALATYQSKSRADLRAAKADVYGDLKGFALLDLAFGRSFGLYTIEAFAKNLLDERAQLSKSQQCGACDQRTYTVTVPPRTLGVRLGSKF
jgi:iron complex outermembrane recepter protein